MDTALISILEKLGAGAGIIVVLIVLRVLVPGWVYADEKKRNAIQAEELKTLRESRDAAVQALNDTKNVMAALQTGLRMGMHGGEPPPPDPGDPAP